MIWLLKSVYRCFKLIAKHKNKEIFLWIFIVRSFTWDIYLSSWQGQGLDGLLGVGFLYDNGKIRPLVGVKILSLLLLSRLPCRVWAHLILSVIIILHSRPDLTIITIIVIMITIAIIYHGVVTTKETQGRWFSQPLHIWKSKRLQDWDLKI